MARTVGIGKQNFEKPIINDFNQNMEIGVKEIHACGKIIAGAVV